MPAPFPAAELSSATGGEVAVRVGCEGSIAGRIAERVAAMPDGIIRSYRDHGGTEVRTYAALWRRAGDVARALSTTDARPSSIVVILAGDILDYLPAVWACLRGGFVPVALMGEAHDAIFRNNPVFERLLSTLGAPVILADDTFAKSMTPWRHRLPGTILPLDSITPGPAWADHPGLTGTAWLVATSGTSGQAKLVALSSSAVLARNVAQHWTIETTLPNALGTFPLDGVTGQHAAFLHHDSWTQIAHQLMVSRPAAILDAIEAHDIATLTLTTSMIRSILAAEAGCSRRRRLGSLRLVGFGAEPIFAGLVQDFAALIARHGADPGVLIAGYGTTETGSLVAGSRALLKTGASQPVCVGAAWHGVSLRVTNEDGAIAAEAEIGHVEVSCPAKIFSTYLGDPELAAAAFTGDGWWKTGDLGQLVGGELTLHGRAKDVLIHNGRKLSLADIDAEIQQALGIGGVGHGYCIAGTASQAEGLGVVFDAGPGRMDAQAAAAIRTAIVRRFGIVPQSTTAIQAASIPRSSVGKVRRSALFELARQASAVGAAAPGAQPSPRRDSVHARLGMIWANVLGLDRAAREDDDFFEQGGDSLRAVALDQQIGDAFGIRVPSEAFFAQPTFRHLARSVRERLAAAAQGERQGTMDDATPWRLPAALRQGLSSALAHWPGDRASDGSLIAGHNIAGDRPPIVWIFNASHEPAKLARALGPQQPLFAMRSGYQLIDYTEDEVQSIVLRYVVEIQQVCPTGPIFVAGNCQGGIIALAIAQHLIRRKRHVPLLVLMDWAFELQAYQGRVLLISGRDNFHLNPRRQFASPERAWARAFAEHAFAEIPGGFAEGFEAPYICALVGTLQAHMAAARHAAPRLMPECGYRATVRSADLGPTLRCGESRMLDVSVTNASDVTWGATSASGVVLGSRWLRADDPAPEQPQPRAKLPKLAPRETAMLSLGIVAPTIAGGYTLVLDLLEEGNRWFGVDKADRFEVPVTVSGI